MAGRKKIYDSVKERRKHVRPLYLKTDARDLLKSQAKELNMTLIDYMDYLAESHENKATDFFSVKTNSGNVVLVSPDVIAKSYNGTLANEDVDLQRILSNAKEVKENATK